MDENIKSLYQFQEKTDRMTLQQKTDRIWSENTEHGSIMTLIHLNNAFAVENGTFISTIRKVLNTLTNYRNNEELGAGTGDGSGSPFSPARMLSTVIWHMRDLA